MNKQEIPLMFCFDNNYVIPAAVAFYSMLENCNRNYYYKLYILHTDISKGNQDKLKENVKEFSEFSELIFVNMENKFEDLWNTIGEKGHFSKEVMYKVLVASIFPKYDKIIVSDVDVVFLNDISESYFMLDTNEDYYLAGIKMIGKMKWYLEQLSDKFSSEEIEKLNGFCGGYIVFNLKKIRKDRMEDKFVNCFETEGYRINQMEQDVLNLCCYPKTKQLPLKYLACSYMWDEYKTDEDKETDIHYKKEEIEDAMTNTVQLHYATSRKPWKNVDCTKADIWFKYLMKTNFVDEYLKNLPNKIVLPEQRIRQIENEGINRERNIIENEIADEVRKRATLKFKINSKFEKYRIFRAVKYVSKNPLFLFKRDFYAKAKKKLDNQNFSLIIMDDLFPSVYSPFRYEEYMKYFKNIDNVYVLTTGASFDAVNEKRNVKEVIYEFEEKYPEYAGRIMSLDLDNKKKLKDIPNKIALITFLQNVQNPQYDNLELLEKYEIPFIFTLYPGGGFFLNNKISDNKLRKICSSKFLKKVIVTQKNTYDYLIEKKFCIAEQIEFIYGVVTPEEILNTEIGNKKYYKNGKETLDICFVAHKYSEQGKDKGYDLFIESAKKLSKKNSNIRFHVIGGFDKNDIDIKEIEEKINFYGVKESKWLVEFYKDMDLIISPNRPFILAKGAFDGFPTGSCTEAMISGVVLLCTDELNLNIKFEDKKDLIIVKPEVENIVKEVENLYNNPEKIIEIASNGRNKTKKIYSEKIQIKPRINLIKKVAKKIYN